MRLPFWPGLIWAASLPSSTSMPSSDGETLLMTMPRGRFSQFQAHLARSLGWRGKPDPRRAAGWNFYGQIAKDFHNGADALGHERTPHGHFERLRGNEVAIFECLHHVLRGRGTAAWDDFAAVDRGAAFELERGGVHSRGASGVVSVIFTWLVLAGINTLSSLNPDGGVLQQDRDRLGETIFAQRINRGGDAVAGAGVEAGGHDAQREVRLRRADAKAIAIFRAAFVLGCR